MDLLRHEEFVRKTLRGLLRDDAKIDEAVQETWLRVLRWPHALPRQPHTWLARIARHCAVSGWRSERRRQDREVVAGRDRVVESAAVSLGRMEMRQRIVAATMELAEPYRSVVMLRYEQDLEVATIARQLGRSPATVRSQLSRAHALLRERLDRDFGGRERWCVLATPLLRMVAGGSCASSSVVLLLGLAAGLLVATLAWSFYSSRDLLVPVAPNAATVALVLPRIESSASLLPAADAAERVGVVLQEPKPERLAGLQERLFPAVELRDRRYFDDYEAATFSLEHGLRDDPDLKLTRNDWDVLYADQQFDVDTVADDNSAILDLGKMAPREFGAWTPANLTFAKRAPVVAGHAYYIGTRDSDTELAAVVFVTAQDASTCTLDWYATDGTDRAQGSIADPGLGKAWVRQLAAVRALQVASPEPVLREPLVRLQLRGGAGGGNLRRLDMVGGAERVEEVRREPIDIQNPATIHDRFVGHCEGGFVPTGHEFVITRIDYAGGNPGDGNGHGAFRVAVAGQTLVEVASSAQPIRGTWHGRAVVPCGSEASAYFEIGNSSWGEVWLRGEFVARQRDPKGGFGGRNAGFFAAGPRPVAPKVWLLGVPSARLQVCAGNVGGNPCRIDLRGCKGLYVDRRVNAPIDFEAPLAEGLASVAFARGGVVPPGTVFVVTKVRYSGRAGAGGTKGGAFRIVIAGQAIVDERDGAEPIAGEWTGALQIVPGEESRTYVEVANDSRGDVELFGAFERQ